MEDDLTIPSMGRPSRFAGQLPQPEPKAAPSQAYTDRVASQDQLAAQQLAQGKPVARAPVNGLGIPNPTNGYQAGMQVGAAILTLPPKVVYDTAKGILVDGPAAMQAYHESNTAIRQLQQSGTPMDAAYMESLEVQRSQATGETVLAGVGYGAPATAGGMVKQLGTAGAIDKTITPTFGTRNIPTEQWRKASEMYSGGATPSQVWKETKLRITPDGLVTREFDDSTMNFKPGALKEIPDVNMVSDPKAPLGWTIIDNTAGTKFTATGTVRDVLTDSETLTAYPELLDAEIKVDIYDGAPKEGSLSLDPNTGKFVIKVTGSTRDQALGTIVHEIQHIIQEMENMPSGGNPADSLRLHNVFERQRERNLKDATLRLNQIGFDSGLRAGMLAEKVSRFVKEIETIENLSQADYKKMKPDLDRLYGELDVARRELHPLLKPGDVAKLDDEINKIADNVRSIYPGDFQAYKRLAGEVEARLAGGRAALTPEMRDRVDPNYSDVNVMGLKEDIAPADQLISMGRMKPGKGVNKSVDEPPVSNPNTKLDDVTKRRVEKNTANDNLSSAQTGLTRQEMMDQQAITPDQARNLAAEIGNELARSRREVDVRRKYYFNDEADIPLDADRLRNKVGKDLRASDPIMWKRFMDANKASGTVPFEGLATQLEGVLVGADPVRNMKILRDRYDKWAKDTKAEDHKAMKEAAAFFRWAYTYYFEGK